MRGAALALARGPASLPKPVPLQPSYEFRKSSITPAHSTWGPQSLIKCILLKASSRRQTFTKVPNQYDIGRLSMRLQIK